MLEPLDPADYRDLRSLRAAIARVYEPFVMEKPEIVEVPWYPSPLVTEALTRKRLLARRPLSDMSSPPLGNKETWEDNVTGGIGERIKPAAVASGGYRDHLGRYLFAGHFVAGRSVVDLCCGNGYGSHLLLAAGAVRVKGIDIATDAIARGRAELPRPGVRSWRRGPTA